MDARHQQKLTKNFKSHADGNVVFWMVAKLGNNKSLFVCLSRATVGNKQKIGFTSHEKLSRSGQAFSVFPGSSRFCQFFRRGSA